MAEASVNPGDQTVTVTEDDNTQVQETQRLVLKLKKPEDKRKVKWEEGTVDNELMNKKKSKCCCIYEKPRMFGESSSEDDSDDECSSHCRGHKKHSHKDQPEDGASGSGAGADESMAAS